MALKFSGFTTGATTANTLVVGYDSALSTNNQYTLAEVGEGMFGTDFSKTNFSWEYSNTRLGIGTASPSAALQVNSNAGEEGLVVNGSQNQYVSSFRSDTTTGQAWGPYIRGGSNSSDAGLIVDKADGTTTYFKVRGDGNVGIGVTDPDSFLEVFGTTTQQKWSYDADSFVTMTVADSSNTTIETGETGSLEMKVGGNLRLSAGAHIFQNAAGIPLADLETITSQCFMMAASDETTDITATADKVRIQMPYAFTLKEIKASLTTAPTGSGATTVNVYNVTDGDTVINTAALSFAAAAISANSTSFTAGQETIAEDDVIAVDVAAVAGTTGGAGLKVTLIGYQTV